MWLARFGIALRLRAVLDEGQHPLMRVRQIGVAAGGEGAQQVERRRRLPIGLELPARIGRARLRRELGAVDDVAAIGRQLDAAALFGRRSARLGELAGDAADLDHRRRRRIGQHHRHLQEQAEEIADVVGAVLGETLGAIAALQQKSVAGRDLRQRALEVARLAGKNQRRKARKLRLDVGERLGVGVVGHLHDRLGAPGIGAPFGRVCSLRHASLQTVIPGAASSPRARNPYSRTAAMDSGSRRYRGWPE